MEKNELENWRKAGRIAAESLQFGVSLVKPKTSVLEIAEKIEERISQLGGKPAFPVNISTNETAAHYSPFPNDTLLLKADDIVKIDIGVHIVGCIGDCAGTIDLSGKNQRLVKASEEALKAAVKLLTENQAIEICKLGKAIEETIKKQGFQPIKNLSGHIIQKWNLHAGLNIPNYDNGDETKLEKGDIIAIEPFATTGCGFIDEGRPSGIFIVANLKNTRDIYARRVLEEIKSYNNLPFAKRWLAKKFDMNMDRIIAILSREGTIREYGHLVERSKGLVSQAEHTLYIGDEVEVLTASK